MRSRDRIRPGDGRVVPGHENERGRIAEGYAADIIAVEGNPLEDISTLMNVSFVMKDGRVAKGTGQ